MEDTTLSDLATLWANWTAEGDDINENIDPNANNNYAEFGEIERIDEIMNSDTIKKWSMDRVMQWVLNLYNSNSFRIEDINMPVLKHITGEDLLKFNEQNCEEVDQEKSKWLYDQVQDLVRKCEALELNEHTDVLTHPPSSDDESKKTSRLSVEICDLTNLDSIKKWTMDQVMLWILNLYESNSYRFEDINLPVLKEITGEDLLKFNETNCEEVDRNKSKWLYQQVQELVRKCQSVEYVQNSNGINLHPSISITVNNTVRPGRGRPRKNLNTPKPAKIGRIWEFLRDILKDRRYCPKIIRWENIDNLEFKLEDNKAVATIWGQRKNKHNMKYENFSRSIRHYYKLKHSKIKSVPHKKLVYKFTEEALTSKDFEEFRICSNDIRNVQF